MVVNRISSTSTDGDDLSKYRSGNYIISSTSSSIGNKEPSVILGPGQIHPKGYRLTSGRYGELKLGLIKIKGTVEVEVSSFIQLLRTSRETLNIYVSYIYDY